MPIKLILIRHGETDLNRQKRYCGSTDIDLNAKGMWQAQRLSKRLKSEEIQRAYSSGQQRAKNFLRIALRSRAVEEDSSWREINFGVLEGLTHQEALKKYCLIYQQWLNNPLGAFIPGAESLADFSGRVKQALAKVLSLSNSQTSAIFTHAGPIRIILGNILKINLKNIWEIKQDSGNINIIKFTKAKAQILLQNDTSYLNE